MPGLVKFTYSFSETKVDFLDLEISKENGKLQTNLYVKPTNLQLYLDYFSNHPEHCKVGLVYIQALRIIERCSKEDDRDLHLINIIEKLLLRNYPEELIESKFRKAKEKDRKQLIFKQRKQPTKNDKVQVIFTHTAANPRIHQRLREGKNTWQEMTEQRLLYKISKLPPGSRKILSEAAICVKGDKPPCKIQGVLNAKNAMPAISLWRVPTLKEQIQERSTKFTRICLAA
jgi:hypothetical protein